MQLSIEEYFKYHPPTTPERIALHDRVNRDTLEICKAFIASKNDVEALAIRDAAILLADEVCLDLSCNDWAKGSIKEALKIAASYLNKDVKAEAILMHVQQFRMFLNQGITVDELKRQKLAASLAAVTTEHIAEIFRIHGESVPESNCSMAQNKTINFDIVQNRFTVYLTRFEELCLEKYRRGELSDSTLAQAWSKTFEDTEQILNIVDYENHPDPIDRYRSGEWAIDLLARELDLTIFDTNKVLDNIFGKFKPIMSDDEIANMKPIYKGIHLTLDGDKWCALVGQDLQVGIAGFGDDPIAALSDLYAKLQGLEFVELGNGDEIYSTTMKQRVSINTKETQAFVDVYGKALFIRSIEGFTNREILIADWVGDILPDDEEEIGGGYLMSNQPYNYTGVWYSSKIYHQFDSVSYLKIKYYWANPEPGNSQPGSKDWEQI